jgi:hypothetical protein
MLSEDEIIKWVESSIEDSIKHNCIGSSIHLRDREVILQMKSNDNYSWYYSIDQLIFDASSKGTFECNHVCYGDDDYEDDCVCEYIENTIIEKQFSKNIDIGEKINIIFDMISEFNTYNFCVYCYSYHLDICRYIGDMSTEECYICYEPMNLNSEYGNITICNNNDHKIHRTCFNKMIIRNKCPLCRQYKPA